jgi:hypothetical protein
MGQVKNLRGKRFGHLQVPEGAEPEMRGGHACWPVICSKCGTKKWVRGTKLQAGSTVSCGCERADPDVRRAARKGPEAGALSKPTPKSTKTAASQAPPKTRAAAPRKRPSAPAVSVETPVPPLPGPATTVLAAPTPAIPAESGPKTAPPEVGPKLSAEAAEERPIEAGPPVSDSAPAPPPTIVPATIEDKITAALQLVLPPGVRPTAAEVKFLLDYDTKDPHKLLRCLEWIQKHGRTYVTFNLFFSDFNYFYAERNTYTQWPSPFLDDERRAQLEAREARK